AMRRQMHKSPPCHVLPHTCFRRVHILQHTHFAYARLPHCLGHFAALTRSARQRRQRSTGGQIVCQRHVARRALHARRHIRISWITDREQRKTFSTLGKRRPRRRGVSLRSVSLRSVSLRSVSLRSVSLRSVGTRPLHERRQNHLRRRIRDRRQLIEQIA